MADFSADAPVEPVKIGDYLHDRSRIPEGPKLSPLSWAGQNWGLVLGLVLSIGGAALAVQTRAAWESHRDWVVPAIMLGAALGGLMLGHLMQRRKGNITTPVMIFTSLAMTFTVLNIWRGYVTDGDDGARDALTILAAVMLAIAVVTAVLGAIITEAKDPTRPPTPEL